MKEQPSVMQVWDPGPDNQNKEQRATIGTAGGG